MKHNLKILPNEQPLPPHGGPLPMPDGRPVPCFFGRRFLTRRELIETGLVANDMTLRRLIAEGRFPPPLELGRRLRLWDAVELAEFVSRLAAARGEKSPTAAA
jgi:predicted DNA-binding transcriptional regulator AlpA